MSRTVEVAPERFEIWLERFTANNPDGPQRIESVERFDHTPVVVVLVRRGGYAVAVVVDGRMVVHKVGSRHVQSRTAAGGWSQQRFARRRANQADALVEAVAEHLARIMAESPAAPAGVVAGGDKALVRELLADRRLASLAALPRRELFDIPDPGRAVLEEAVRRGRAVRVCMTDGPVSPT
ncbi:MAG: acVLRF1 family peptidyl-tRNA hydrolase [Dermatophilaceae bacterium]